MTIREQVEEQFEKIILAIIVDTPVHETIERLANVAELYYDATPDLVHIPAHLTEFNCRPEKNTIKITLEASLTSDRVAALAMIDQSVTVRGVLAKVEVKHSDETADGQMDIEYVAREETTESEETPSNEETASEDVQGE